MNAKDRKAYQQWCHKVDQRARAIDPGVAGKIKWDEIQHSFLKRDCPEKTAEWYMLKIYTAGI